VRLSARRHPSTWSLIRVLLQGELSYLAYPQRCYQWLASVLTSRRLLSVNPLPITGDPLRNVTYHGTGHCSINSLFSISLTLSHSLSRSVARSLCLSVARSRFITRSLCLSLPLSVCLSLTLSVCLSFSVPVSQTIRTIRNVMVYNLKKPHTHTHKI